MKPNPLTSLGLALVITTATAGPVLADARQRDKNNMRNLGMVLGGLAAHQAIKGKTTNALVLGAGAAYAGKKYEDARKAQRRESARRRYSRSRRTSYYRSGSASSNVAPRRRYVSSSNRTRRSYVSSTPRYHRAYRSAPRPVAPVFTPVDVVLNGRAIAFSDQGARMMNNRVYVPLRGVLEKMGASVSWSDGNRMVTASRNGRTVQLPVNQYSARVNGSRYDLDAPARVVGGRTMVPLRFVAEAFGAKVDWNAAERVARINSSPRTVAVR